MASAIDHRTEAAGRAQARPERHALVSFRHSELMHGVAHALRIFDSCCYSSLRYSSLCSKRNQMVFGFVKESISGSLWPTGGGTERLWIHLRENYLAKLPQVADRYAW